MGQRIWLEDSIAHQYLPTLSPLQNDAKGRAKAQTLLETMRQQWQDRGFKALKQQQSLMDRTRRAIKDHLGATHWSLNIIKLTTAEHTQINDEKQGRVAERNEQVQWLGDPDAIVATAVRLLESPSWADVAAGLSVLTGRRSSELLATAHFTPQTQWSVTFTGALKRRGETQTLSFEIPTLTTAQRVCDALAKVRRELPGTESLSASQVNAKYGAAVARACDQHFAALVPLRAGKDNLYTHLSRSVYATIATFWYCPPSVNETEFKAAIQGHYAVLDEQNPELRRTLAASRHYSDYELADAVVARYGGKRKGIKLGSGGVQPLAMFKDAWQRQPSQATSELDASRQQRTTVRLWLDDKPLLETVLQRLNFAGTQQERMHQLLQWAAEQLHETQQEQTLTLPPTAEVVPINGQVATAAASPESEAAPTETAAPAPVVSPASIEQAVEIPPATGLETKLDRLVDVMTQFMEWQMHSQPATATPSTPPPTARPTLPRKPDGIPTGEAAAPSAQVDAGSAALSPRRKSSETDDRINRVIDAIIKHNSTPELPHDEKWAITINALKSFVKSQRKLEQRLTERRPEIDAHYQQQQIDPATQNLRHRGKRQLTDVIDI